MTDSVSLEAGGPIPVTFTLNGVPRTVVVEPDVMLLGVLRDEFGLTGAKPACEVGVCGACTVLVDGEATSSCHTFAALADGAEVRTVEGLAADAELRPLQEAFVDDSAFQCGFCTSGQLMAAASLVLSGRLDTATDAEIRTYMLGNLCRCGAYYGIARALDRFRGTAR
ncbi:MAG: (2Fe-2S)-binding protein [Pseudonocardia sp.]|nr:(2Fe-2S)-binding protein [Pseudonocardia sp.]